jgi:hypothetical protein
MKKSIFVAALMGSVFALPVVFANTNAGSKLFVCSTPQQSDLAQADFEALTWVEVKSLGNLGETGSKTNILNYDTWDTIVTQKAKGITDAGSPTLEFARIPTDPGQIIMRQIAKTNLNYAFKIVRNDPAVSGGIGTVIYNRGLVTGPTRPGGKNEDFDLEVFTLALNQPEVVVDPGAGGVAPTNTVAPAITGTAEVGETLNLSNGTFTGDAVIGYAYQWFAGGVAIPGATANTLILGSAQLGKIIQARVSASNASGSAQAFSAPTVAVAAAS